MVYVTGDIHGGVDIHKLTTDHFPIQKELTKEDYVVICGDFGLVWDESATEHYWRKWLSGKNFTTLFIDGNHENFPLLRSYPTKEMFGGVVREIVPSVYHLERGQVLCIDDRAFFVMGGARSHDKEWRVDGVSWWEEEIPSLEEMERGNEALERSGWKVDCVLSHCAPRGVQMLLSPYYESDPIVSYLEFVRQKIEFKRWLFGHYHIDRQINEQFVALYNNIVRI